ncbi:MAG: hypothetical protein OXJ90_02345 [Spirochaetaceae bacterium]|nr:hypothetical protein [Spirochaetaceae bacterium]
MSNKTCAMDRFTALDENQQQTALTLYEHWSAKKRHACAQQELKRISDSLEKVANAIRAELPEGGGGPVVRSRQGQTLYVAPPTQVSGPEAACHIPEATEVQALLEELRDAAKSTSKLSENVSSL